MRRLSGFSLPPLGWVRGREREGECILGDARELTHEALRHVQSRDEMYADLRTDCVLSGGIFVF